jgi:hypothetical protein
MRARLTTEAFKAALKAGGKLPDAILCKRGFAKAEAVTGDEAPARSITWTISTATKDRHGDIIDQEGWELDNFKAGGVVLWNHDAYCPPIAKPLDTSIVDGALKSTAQFATRDQYELADTVYQLALGGFIKAASVGFLPRAYEEFLDEGDQWPGIKFTQQELLEWSPVSIPANPEALQDAKSKGINVAPIAQYVRRFLDGETSPLWLTRATAEQAYAATRDDGNPVHSVPAPAIAAAPAPSTNAADATPCAPPPIEVPAQAQPQSPEPPAAPAVKSTRERVAELKAAMDVHAEALRAQARAGLATANEAAAELTAMGVELGGDIRAAVAAASALAGPPAPSTNASATPHVCNRAPDTAALDVSLTSSDVSDLGAIVSAAVRSAILRAAGRIGD